MIASFKNGEPQLDVEDSYAGTSGSAGFPRGLFLGSPDRRATWNATDRLSRNEEMTSRGNEAFDPLPHARHRHAYVILRVDHVGEGEKIREHVQVKKVVTDQDYARREVDRLNLLNNRKNSEYYWEIAQLDTTGFS
jgi:hypothetical protein